MDEMEDVAQQINQSASCSAVYRTLHWAGLNTLQEKEKEKAKKFKAYDPGYRHVNLTYLPKSEGVIQDLFIVIDRDTQLIL